MPGHGGEWQRSENRIRRILAEASHYLLRSSVEFNFIAKMDGFGTAQCGFVQSFAA